MNDRDFKGIWIPKEIWLNNELDLTEKVLFAEIDSLDNETHCTAGNEYFTEFFKISESKVTRAIKHLKDLGLIECSFDGRIREIRVVKKTILNSQNDEYINTYNNIYNIETNKLVSTPTPEQMFFEEDISVEKPKKKNLYQKCIDEINEFTSNLEVRELLVEYLKMRLEISDKKFGSNTFKGMLKKLRTLTESAEECKKIIQQAIDRQYMTFYPYKEYKSYTKKTGRDIETTSLVGKAKITTQEEKDEIRRLVESGELEEY